MVDAPVGTYSLEEGVLELKRVAASMPVLDAHDIRIEGGGTARRLVFVRYSDPVAIYEACRPALEGTGPFPAVDPVRVDFYSETKTLQVTLFPDRGCGPRPQPYTQTVPLAYSGVNVERIDIDVCRKDTVA